MRRREMFIGGAFIASAGIAFALEPRQRVTLKPAGKIADVIPLNVGDWSAENADGLVQPEDGTLAAALYSEIVGRVYHNRVNGAAVMMLAAYGDTQSDMLQLHRPESCYPAVGFRLLSTQPTLLPLARPGATIPARAVIAEAPERTEAIIYWARIGESLPNTAGQQREARLINSFRGVVPDGILVRFSTLTRDGEDSFRLLKGFVPELLQAVAPANRSVLIGTQLAAALNAERP